MAQPGSIASGDVAAVSFEAVTKQFGNVVALDKVSLAIGRGEFMTLLGPSGCGKTTLLNLAAGFLGPDGGSIAIDGKCVNEVPTYKREIGMMFQSYALFPHMNVAENVAYGLKARGVRRQQCAKRVAEALSLVKLTGMENRKPRQLSGGQQQRVALARALVVRPDLLLFDEPLSNLDARLRDEMRLEIRELQRRIGITTVLVTHDIAEAFTMSDRMAVMQAGKVVQIGRADEIYRAPANRFVANFVGPTNELALSCVETVGSRRRALAAGDLSVWLPDHDSGSGRDHVRLVLRPEALRVATGETGTENQYRAEVEDVVYLGGMSECRVRVGALRLSALLPSAAAARLRPGEQVSVGWNANDGVIIGGE